MAPTRRAKAASDTSPVGKNKQGRMHSEQLGPKWSKRELRRFFEACRKYGQNWDMVAYVVCTRNIEMVEALYNMNRAYLSLTQGRATVVGIIAMMTDHYNVMEGSESEGESNDAPGTSRKPHECNQPQTVEQRTPRFPVQYSSKKDYGENSASPIRKGRKSEGDEDFDVTEVAELLTKTSHRGGSTQLSQTPNIFAPQSLQRMHSPSWNVRANSRDTSLEDDCLEGSAGGETGDSTRDSGSLMDMEGAGTVEIRKRTKVYRNKENNEDIGDHQFDDGGESCIGTEGLHVSIKGKNDIEVADNSELEALHALVDLSLMIPESKMESGSSAEGRPNAKKVHSPTKQRSIRKRYLPKAVVPKSSENILKTQLYKHSNTLQDRLLYLKEKMSCFLSSHLVRRWCMFEWFYSAINFPWYSKREFEEYLNHVGLGHLLRLTRVEWGVIRCCLGKPRRFSEHFLSEEREKLKEYRESMRKHYAELRSGVREGLPRDLARPLSVGQRVIAIHPKTREVHDGSVLTVDHDKCRVQFDRPDIGVEFDRDVDCMPLNPLDNMPEALKRRNISFDKIPPMLPHIDENFERPVMTISSQILERTQPMNTAVTHGKRDTIHRISQLKGGDVDIADARTAVGQPGPVTHNQAREADIQVLSEATKDPTWVSPRNTQEKTTSTAKTQVSPEKTQEDTNKKRKNTIANTNISPKKKTTMANKQISPKKKNNTSKTQISPKKKDEQLKMKTTNDSNKTVQSKEKELFEMKAMLHKQHLEFVNYRKEMKEEIRKLEKKQELKFVVVQQRISLLENQVKQLQEEKHQMQEEIRLIRGAGITRLDNYQE